MLRQSWWGLTLVFAAACEPPPAPEAGGAELDPRIVLLYPDSTVPIGLDPDDGHLRFLVAVDLVDIEFNDPGLAEVNTDGEGHYHVSLNDAYVDAPPNLWYEIDQEGWQSGDAVKLTVSLQDNEHGDLDQYENWRVNFEFTIE